MVRSRAVLVSVVCGIIGLLGCKPGRAGPGGNPSACRWKGLRSILLGDNQVRHCLAVPAVNCGRAVAARGDLGVLAPSVKREPQHVAFGERLEPWSFMAGRMSTALPGLDGSSGHRPCSLPALASIVPIGERELS